MLEKGRPKTARRVRTTQRIRKSRDLTLTGRSLEVPVNGILVSLLSKVVKKDPIVDRAKEMMKLNPEM